MNSIKRLVFGVTSTFLLAFGFSRAADHFDPMSISLRFSNDHGSLGVAPPCTGPCELGVAPPCTGPCEIASHAI